jgi:hypothetical protein
VGFIRLLDLATCGLDWKFVEKNEALLVREIQVSEPAPEPFGIMAQVRLLQGLFTEYSETTMKGLAAVPTLSIARSVFCPGRSAELTSSDHFIFDQTHNVHKYYRGACKVIEAGVLNDLVRLECRYGSRQSFNVTTLRSCKRLNPDEIKTIVRKFLAEHKTYDDEEEYCAEKRNMKSFKKLRFTSKKAAKTKCPRKLSASSLESEGEAAESESEQMAEVTTSCKNIADISHKAGAASSAQNSEYVHRDGNLFEMVCRSGGITVDTHEFTMKAGDSHFHTRTSRLL